MGKDHHIDVFRRRVAYPQSCNLERPPPFLGRLVKDACAGSRRDGVTANIVVPGRIATNRVNYLDGQKAKRENRSVQEVAAESASSIPVGRYGEPIEYADVITFLASARASYINGSTIRVDGGLITSI
jgi:NAD(P)-dependent dehydrogenase (short-subunit alcohol dehydrogenase family)